jgi:hypothetical protein
MDPLTLFALANGAVSAVKAGCKLYKDIKSAAGDVNDVLKDLDKQFHGAYEAKGKNPPPEAIKQFNEEKARVKELNKKANSDEHTNIYTEIGEHLGAYYDNLYKCIAVFENEERRSRNEIYTGDASLGKRALQRVLMKKQLEQMGTELREIMVYQSPPELGALHTEVEEMMKKLGEQQKVLINRQINIEHARSVYRAKQMAKLKHRLYGVGGVLVVLLFWIFCMWWVAERRIEDYPEYGTGFFPSQVSDRDRIVAERNKKYWDAKAAEYRNRQNNR